MELLSLKYVGVGLATLGMLGAAIGVGNIFAALIKSIARNPSAESQLSKYAYIGAGLAEAMGIFAFLMTLLIYFS
ncbi:F0F1 ATP synthase subunit C [Candidatus Lariskella endosymbiont of Epinotia ramella]|uniref:F0F1 ATP synthase subunit C n=2 Tax=unclassified Candidatus Lariskella TaxID=2632605 RepID=UPI0030CCA94F